MFDFIPTATDGQILAMYPKSPEYDIGLYVRPFALERLVFIFHIFNIVQTND